MSAAVHITVAARATAAAFAVYAATTTTTTRLSEALKIADELPVTRDVVASAAVARELPLFLDGHSVGISSRHVVD